MHAESITRHIKTRRITLYARAWGALGCSSVRNGALGRCSTMGSGSSSNTPVFTELSLQKYQRKQKTRSGGDWQHTDSNSTELSRS